MDAPASPSTRDDAVRVGRVASSLVGRALGAVFGAVARMRRASKPLHPRGTIGRGALHRLGGDLPSGVDWLDEPGRDEVLVRMSRSVGLPAPTPDVFGLAMRVPTAGDAYGDLLFASAGLGPLSRFVFTPTWSPDRRSMTTILPYRTPAGAVLLCATLSTHRTVELSWASGSGPWHVFARLRLSEQPVDDLDAEVSFDPVRNTVPGLEVYGWVRRLREPSYLIARRSRGLPG